MASADDNGDRGARRRVVVTGVGAVSPLGVGAPTTFERWVDGQSGIEDGVARCDEFEPTDFLSKKEIRRSDRFTHLSIGAAEEAISQADLADGSKLDPERIGCILATGVGGIGTIERNHDTLREKGETEATALAKAGECRCRSNPNLQNWAAKRSKDPMSSRIGNLLGNAPSLPSE